MKKIITAAVAVLAVAAMVLTASAAAPVGRISAPEVSGITVDGKISTDEYNGAAKITLDEKNLKAGVVGEKIAEGFSADVYFGWDAKYLYVAYDITDGTKCYFTEYTWNGGDNVQLLLDVEKKLNRQREHPRHEQRHSERCKTRYSHVFGSAAQGRRSPGRGALLPPMRGKRVGHTGSGELPLRRICHR